MANEKKALCSSSSDSGAVISAVPFPVAPFTVPRLERASTSERPLFFPSSGPPHTCLVGAKRTISGAQSVVHSQWAEQFQN